jgi:hypothetical protein
MTEAEELELLELEELEAQGGAEPEPPPDLTPREYEEDELGRPVPADDLKAVHYNAADTLALGYGPEIVSGAQSAVGAGDYKSNLKKNRDALGEVNAKAPAAAAAGSFVGALPMAAALPATGAAATRLGRIGQSAVTSGTLGFLANPGEHGDRASNAELAFVLGGLAGYAFDPETLRSAGDAFNRISNRRAAHATQGNPAKMIELEKHGKLEQVGERVREDLLGGAGGWFKTPRQIHLMSEQKLADLGEDIASDVAAADMAGGQSISTTAVADKIGRELPGSDTHYLTAGGKQILRGPIQAEVDNLRMYGEPVSNPAMLGADYGGQGVVPTGNTPPVDYSDFQPYLDSSNSGRYTPDRNVDPGHWRANQNWENLDMVYGPPSAPQAVGPAPDPYAPVGPPSDTRLSPQAPDPRERVATPGELWRLKQGIGKRINFAHPASEMAPQEFGLKEVYWGLDDPLIKSVEGAFPNPVGIKEKMGRYSDLSHARDMSFQGATADYSGVQHPASSRSPKNAAIGALGHRFRGVANSFASKTTETVADVMLNRPDRIPGKLLGPLMKAYSENRDQFNAMVYLLMKRPEFREKVLDEEVDRSSEPVSTLEEAQQQYTDEN